MKIGPLDLSDALNIYNAYRAKIVHEDTLINYRLSWMLWAEAIFFAMWGALALERARSHYPGPVSSAMVAVSLVGLFVAIGSKMSLNAAHAEICNIKSDYHKQYYYLDKSDSAIPGIHADELNHRDGSILAKFMPWIFGAMQFFVIIYTLISYFLEL